MGPGLVALGVLAALVLARPAGAQTFRITGGPGGGDCQQIGVWDDTARTCTLNGPVTGTVVLAEDRLTLDGAGHAVQVPGGQTTALAADGVEGLTVRDVTVADFWVGVWLAGGGGHRISRLRAVRPRPLPGPFGDTPCAVCIWDARDCRVEESQIDGRLWGIRLERTQGCTVARTGITDVEVGIKLVAATGTVVEQSTIRPRSPGLGLHLAGGGPTLVTTNLIERGSVGIEVDGAQGSRIIFNELKNNALGLEHWAGRATEVLCNDFSGHQVAAQLWLPVGAQLWWNNFLALDDAADVAGGNQFDRPRPVGGNYWQKDAPVCPDPDGDGFCNVPHVVGAGQDTLPHVRPIPWRQDPAVCLTGTPGAPPQQGPLQPESPVRP